jgi:hypothetical protein
VRLRVTEVITIIGPITLFQGGKVLAHLVGDRKRAVVFDTARGPLTASDDCAVICDDDVVFYPKRERRHAMTQTSGTFPQLSKPGKKIGGKKGK